MTHDAKFTGIADRLPRVMCRTPEDFLNTIATLGVSDQLARFKAVRAPGGMIYQIPDNALQRITELQAELTRAIRDCPLIVTKVRMTKRRKPKLRLIQGGKS